MQIEQVHKQASRFLYKFKDSLLFPVLTGTISILSAVMVLVGWGIVFTRYYSLSVKSKLLPELGLGYWLILLLGCLILVIVIAALVLFLITNIRQVLFARQQTTFIDSVTHELRSPLASLKLCLETMEIRSLDQKTQDKLINMMKTDVDRLNAFIEHILGAGLIDHQDTELKEKQFELKSLVEHCALRIRKRYALSEKTLGVSFADSEKDQMFFTDPIALETILLNLLDNAVKYSPQNPLVHLAVLGSKSHILFEISDQGMGIPLRFQTKIFRRFYRGDREKTTNIRGTGLGLYVVSYLVKRIGGRLTVESPGEGQGSIFRVELPKQKPLE